MINTGFLTVYGMSPQKRMASVVSGYLILQMVLNVSVGLICKKKIKQKSTLNITDVANSFGSQIKVSTHPCENKLPYQTLYQKIRISISLD